MSNTFVCILFVLLVFLCIFGFRFCGLLSWCSWCMCVCVKRVGADTNKERERDEGTEINSCFYVFMGFFLLKSERKDLNFS